MELANTLQSLIKDEELRHSVAESGLESFRSKFTWIAVLDRYNEITDEIRAANTRKVAA